jgi:hypothetical protein
MFWAAFPAHHQAFLAVHRHWYILCSFDDHLLPGAAAGSKRSSKLHKMYQCRCTARNSWWWEERLPKTCRVVIQTNLEFRASVGFIHKEFFTMHGHTFLKIYTYSVWFLGLKNSPSFWMSVAVWSVISKDHLSSQQGSHLLLTEIKSPSRNYIQPDKM